MMATTSEPMRFDKLAGEWLAAQDTWVRACQAVTEAEEAKRRATKQVAELQKLLSECVNVATPVRAYQIGQRAVVITRGIREFDDLLAYTVQLVELEPGEAAT